MAVAAAGCFVVTLCCRSLRRTELMYDSASAEMDCKMTEYRFAGQDARCAARARGRPLRAKCAEALIVLFACRSAAARSGVVHVLDSNSVTRMIRRLLHQLARFARHRTKNSRIKHCRSLRSDSETNRIILSLFRLFIISSDHFIFIAEYLRWGTAARTSRR